MIRNVWYSKISVYQSSQTFPLFPCFAYGSVIINTTTHKECEMTENLQYKNLQVATFGAGCFWCVEAVFQNIQGVHKVVSGYMGGHVINPKYKDICTGKTGHAEVIQIFFDHTVVTYFQLLEILWYSHDPTTLNRQGNDVGTQYRSVIFYHNEEQKRDAETSINEVTSKLWDDPIVTEVSPAVVFYTAEGYHQDYYNNNSYAPYCRFVVHPKLEKVQTKFSHLQKVNHEH